MYGGAARASRRSGGIMKIFHWEGEPRVFLKCRMPRYRAQATTGTPVDPIPDVYYRRAIVNNRERVLLYHCLLPLIVAINFEA